MTDALFDLPRTRRPTPPPPAFTSPPPRMPALPLSCRSCGRPLAHPWCDHSELPVTGPWDAAARVIAEVMADRDRRTPTRKDHHHG